MLKGKSCNPQWQKWPLALVFGSGVFSAHAQQYGDVGVSELDAVQVTATRFAVPVQELPAAFSVISGDELRARDVTDLRGALLLLGGATPTAGGDGGPNDAAPGLLGSREADDFLLLIDGIPSGAAFVPQYETLSLGNVQRIEVQRGAAPVFYGTAAFAGTINVIHYPAGASPNTVQAGYGSFGSETASGTWTISPNPGTQGSGSRGQSEQSVSAELERQRYSDSRAGADRAHLLYRAGGSALGGAWHADVDATVQHQKPTSPSPIAPLGVDVHSDTLGDDGLDTSWPIDFNQNPADGKIDTNRFQLSSGFDRGAWSGTISFTQTHNQRVQGFLGSGDSADDDVASTADRDDEETATNASGFHQVRDLSELYVDVHSTQRLLTALRATVGMNEVYGLAHVASSSFAYVLPTDGSMPPSSAQVSANDQQSLKALRSFAGIYSQLRWDVTPRLGVLGGVRWNRLDDNRSGSDQPLADSALCGRLRPHPCFRDGDEQDSSRSAAQQSAQINRASGSLGVDWRVWQDDTADLDDVVVYAGWSNSFQAPQIDFGPEDALNSLLPAESQRSYQVGVKADGFDGDFDADLALTLADFDNQPLATEVNGEPAVVAGGRERFSSVDLDVHYRLAPQLKVTASYGYNDGRYRDFATEIDEVSVQLAGNRLPMTAINVSGLGLIYGGAQGVQASLSGTWTGARYLDLQNQVRAPAYLSGDASVGYRWRHYMVNFVGTNLGNRRDPVQASELGESQIYRLQGERLWLKLAAQW